MHHLFFDCCVAKQIWIELNEIAGWNVGQNSESVASMWLFNTKFLVNNIVSGFQLLLCGRSGN